MRALPFPSVTTFWPALALVLTNACHQPGSTSRRPMHYFEPPAPGLSTAPGVGPGPTPAPATAAAAAAAEQTPTGACNFAPGQLFPITAPWNQRIDATPIAAESKTVIGYLAQMHTSSQRFRTDFQFVVQQAPASVPRRAFIPSSDHFSPDCDTMAMPVPVNGRIEGESGYACTQDGDCHLLVHVPETCQLYEMWRANITTSGFSGGCLAAWDTRMTFDNTGRGTDCSSADASGLPITPLLFSASDLTTGSINHAIRLVMPNNLIREHIYVPPATHSTGPTSGPREAPPYGARFRLRPDYDTSNLSKGAQVVATALKRYGMIIVDGGKVSFTAASDQESAVKYADSGFHARALESLRWTDFDMVLPPGPARLWKANCTRTPRTE